MVNRGSSIFATVGLSLLIALPGIKFFIFSSLVNFVVVFMLFLGVIFNFKDVRVNKIQSNVFYLFLMLMFVIFASGMNHDSSFIFIDFLRYLSLFFIIVFVVLLVSVMNLRLFNSILIYWSILLGVLYWLKLINPSGAGELSYLILSMQLGVGYALSLGNLVFGKSNVLVRFIFPIFLIVSILTLSGRMSIILCAVMSVVAYISYIRLSYKNSNNLAVVISIAFLVISIIFLYPILMKYVLNDYFLYKMSIMFEGEDGRALTYANSVNLIMDSPFGSGLHSYNTLLGFYPHNIFLEVGLDAGLLAIVILMIITLYFFGGAARFISRCSARENNVFSVVMASAYLFLSWNTSNNLSSAYVPFTAMIISLYFLFKKGSCK